MVESPVAFRKVTVDPVGCIRDGWELVKPKYGLFLGASTLAMIIGGAVPLGLLLGPMMCGLYLIYGVEGATPPTRDDGHAAAA